MIIVIHFIWQWFWYYLVLPIRWNRIETGILSVWEKVIVFRLPALLFWEGRSLGIHVTMQIPVLICSIHAQIRTPLPILPMIKHTFHECLYKLNQQAIVFKSLLSLCRTAKPYTGMLHRGSTNIGEVPPHFLFLKTNSPVHWLSSNHYPWPWVNKSFKILILKDVTNGLNVVVQHIEWICIWRVEDEFRSVTAEGMELLSGLLVWQWIFLYLLSEEQQDEQAAAGVAVVIQYPLGSVRWTSDVLVLITCCRVFLCWMMHKPHQFVTFGVRVPTLLCKLCQN